MRFHETRFPRVQPMKSASGLWYFIVSNAYPGGRRFAVCTYDPTGNDVETIGAGSLQHPTLAAARTAMRSLVASGK
jgi:hypothetical protein